MVTILKKEKEKYRTWLLNMYYKNCEELESYNLPIYKTVKHYETKNQEYLTKKYLKFIKKT